MSPARIQQVPIEEQQRQLETIVLTQVRDSLALINNNLTKLDDNVRSINDKVVGLLASRYDEQIEEVKRHAEGFRVQQENKWVAADNRFIEHDRQLIRLGLAMAITGFVGGSALTGVIALAIGRVFGVH